MRILGYSRALADVPQLSDDGGKVAAEGGDEEALPGTSIPGRATGAETTSTAVATSSSAGAAALSSGNLLFDSATESVASRQAKDRLFELTIKFVGTVGVSILRLRGQNSPFARLPSSSCCSSNLAAADSDSVVAATGDVLGRSCFVAAASGGGVNNEGRRVVCGSLDLENVTKALPLEYRIAVGRQNEAVGGQVDGSGVQGGVRSLDEANALVRLQALPIGSAEVVLLDAGTGTLPPSGRRRVRFCVLFHAFQGVFQRKISVENLSSPVAAVDAAAGGDGAAAAALLSSATPALRRRQCFYHLIRLFVDDGTVSLFTPSLPRHGLPATAEVSSVRTLRRLSVEAGSTVDVTDAAVGALGSNVPISSATSEDDRLTDAHGHPLPSLEPLSVLVTVAVTPVPSSASTAFDARLSSAGSSGGAGVYSRVDGDQGVGGVPSFRRFRLVAPILDSQSEATTSAMDKNSEEQQGGGARKRENRDEEEEEEDDDEDSDRPWSGGEPFELSPVTVLRRPSVADEISQGDQEAGDDFEDDPAAGTAGDVEFRVTNRLNRPMVLAPYSNLPLRIAPVARRRKVRADHDFAGFGVSFSDEDTSTSWGHGGSSSHRRNKALGVGRMEESSSVDAGEQEQETLVTTPAKGEQHNSRHLGLSMTRCGSTFTLAANATRRLRLGIRPGALTDPLPVAAVEDGRAVPFDGFVALACVDKIRRRGLMGVEQESAKPKIDEMEVAGVPDRVDFSGTTTWARFSAASQTLPVLQSSHATQSLQLVKLVRTVGTYCRPRFDVVGPAAIDLGNVGHTASKRGRRRFKLTLRNLSDTPVPVGMASLSPELEVVDDSNVTSETTEVQRSATLSNSASDTVPRRKTGGHVNAGGGGSGGGSSAAAGGGVFSRRGGGSSARVSSSVGYFVQPHRGGHAAAGAGVDDRIVTWVPARAEVSLAFQLRLSRRRQSWAGAQTFTIRLLNLADSGAEEVAVAVHARVVTHLVRILGLDEPPPSPMLLRLVSPGTPSYPGPPPPLGRKPSFLDTEMGKSPASMAGGFGSFGTPAGGSVRLDPLAIPPLRGAVGRCAGSFQVQNVSDEPVSVKVCVAPAAEVAGVLSLGASMQLQDSSNGVYASAPADGRPSPSVSLLPGDVLEVQVECLALPGARLPPELLPLPPSFEEDSVDAAAIMEAVAAVTPHDWDVDARLLGTVRVEIALEGRLSGGPDEFSAAGGQGLVPGQGEGTLIESVALVGSLVPGPAFGLSRTSVTIALRPPESGGGGGGGDGDGTGPFDQDGPASFLVQNFSGAQGPIRFSLVAGGRLQLARGVRVAAAEEDEDGGRRRPARVVQVVTAVAEPSRGIVSANGKREIIVRLAAASDHAEQDEYFGGYDSGTGELIRFGDRDATEREDAIAAAGMGRLDHGAYKQGASLFVQVTDIDHPGYPPQVVAVHVELPAAVLDYMVMDPLADVSRLGLGVPGTPGAAGADGPIGLRTVGKLGPGGSYGVSNGTMGDGSVTMLADEANGPNRRHSGSR